jgi:hypothetical protein
MVNPDGVDLVTGAIAPDSPEYEAAQDIAVFFPTFPSLTVGRPIFWEWI